MLNILKKQNFRQTFLWKLTPSPFLPPPLRASLQISGYMSEEMVQEHNDDEVVEQMVEGLAQDLTVVKS